MSKVLPCVFQDCKLLWLATLSDHCRNMTHGSLVSWWSCFTTTFISWLSAMPYNTSNQRSQSASWFDSILWLSCWIACQSVRIRHPAHLEMPRSPFDRIERLLLLFSLNRMLRLRSSTVAFVTHIDGVSLDRSPQFLALYRSWTANVSSLSWSDSESDTASSWSSSASSISFSGSDSAFQSQFLILNAWTTFRRWAGWLDRTVSRFFLQNRIILWVEVAHTMGLYHFLDPKIGWTDCHIIYRSYCLREWLQRIVFCMSLTE